MKLTEGAGSCCFNRVIGKVGALVGSAKRLCCLDELGLESGKRRRNACDVAGAANKFLQSFADELVLGAAGGSPGPC